MLTRNDSPWPERTVEAVRFALPPGHAGVPILLALTASVAPGSPADRAGIEAGDLIQEISEKTIRGMDDYNEARDLNSDASRPIIILVRHQGYTRYLAVRPD